VTAAEWGTFASVLELTFKGDELADPEAEAAYQAQLGGLDVGLAEAAVNLLVEDGQTWMPMPGEFMAAARRLERPDAPPWSEAWPVVRRAMARHALALTNGRRPAALEALVADVDEQLGEGPARWVGRTWERLLREPVNDPDVGGAVLKRLGDEYAEACRQAAEDRRAGLALERAGARASVGGGRPALRRLRPERLLPQLPGGAA
jgi:hypothetical protein